MVVEELTYGGLRRRLFGQQDLTGHRFYVGVRQLDIEDEAILQLGEIGSRGGQSGLAGSDQEQATSELVVEDLGGVGDTLGTVGVVGDVGLDFVEDDDA